MYHILKTLTHVSSAVPSVVDLGVAAVKADLAVESADRTSTRVASPVEFTAKSAPRPLDMVEPPSVLGVASSVQQSPAFAEPSLGCLDEPLPDRMKLEDLSLEEGSRIASVRVEDPPATDRLTTLLAGARAKIASVADAETAVSVKDHVHTIGSENRVMAMDDFQHSQPSDMTRLDAAASMVAAVSATEEPLPECNEWREVYETENYAVASGDVGSLNVAQGDYGNAETPEAISQLVPEELETLVVGNTYESIDWEGNWWEVWIDEENADGSYVATVLNDKATKWTQVWAANCRNCVETVDTSTASRSPKDMTVFPREVHHGHAWLIA